MAKLMRDIKNQVLAVILNGNKNVQLHIYIKFIV